MSNLRAHQLDVVASTFRDIITEQQTYLIIPLDYDIVIGDYILLREVQPHALLWYSSKRQVWEDCIEPNADGSRDYRTEEEQWVRVVHSTTVGGGWVLGITLTEMPVPYWDKEDSNE